MTITDDTRRAIERRKRTLSVNWLRDGDRTVWIHYHAGSEEVDRDTFESILHTLPTQYTIFELKDRIGTYEDMIDWMNESRRWLNERA